MTFSVVSVKDTQRIYMKLSKRSLFLAAVAAAMVSLNPLVRAEDTQDSNKPAAPATGDRARRNPAATFNHMAEQLKLSDDQKTKLQPILQDEAKKLRGLRDDTNLTQKDRRAKVRDIRAQTTDQAKNILDKDQFEQFKKLREQGGRPPRSGSGDAAKTPSDSGTNNK
jgi:hypothetical protein